MTSFKAQRSIVAGALLGIVACSVHAYPIDYDPRRAPELRACDDHQHHGRVEQAKQCYRRLADSSNIVTAAEATWALGDLQRANDLFQQAIKANPNSVQPKVRRGRLFLETHQYNDALTEFREVNERLPDDVYAKLGMAHVLADRFEGQATTLIQELLEEDDQLIEAHLLAARMALEEGQFEESGAALDRAADIANKQKLPPLEVHALRAALELSRNERPDAWVKRALDYNPRYGEIYELLAHFEIMRRRYIQATAFLRQAVQVQPELWSAHAELGSNLLRLGEIDEARKHLMAAYSGDPYSATTVNSLRLLDRIDQFELSDNKVTVPALQGARDTQVDVRLRLNKSEANAIRPYVLDIARDGIAAFSKRYGFEPKEPITLELYPDHDDFAVRVAALPGIGLLGVTFGYLVAMDSPSGRASGEFHWGSTLWHELAHVFTLEATDHRVPRWLSEGISVFEEWRTGPTPGVAISPDVITALSESKFLPVSDLDSGFIRPQYPNQVQVSYNQSGLICLFIEQRWGFERLSALLRQFTRNTTTAAAIEATFKMPPAEFDKLFDQFARERFAKLLPRMHEWQQLYQQARQAVQKEQWAEVVEPARTAAELYPEHVGPGSPNLLLARALDKLGRRNEAIVALQNYRKAGGWDPTALRELAKWLDEAGQANAATEVLFALNYVDPLNPDQHTQLGERLLANGKAQDAVREYRVLLALNTHDEATANFGMARALRAAGDGQASRRHLLDALAVAPHYKPAQQLLLQMIEERKNNE
jgi:cellulose synthase operon protein C